MSTISSLSDYNTLKDDIITAVANHSITTYRKYGNGIIRFYDRMMYLLLIRYVKYVYNHNVFEIHQSDVQYRAGNFVVKSGVWYLCVEDIPATPTIAIGNEAYWNVHVSFTYDYDTIVSALDKINRILGTKFEI